MSRVPPFFPLTLDGEGLTPPAPPVNAHPNDQSGRLRIVVNGQPELAGSRGGSVQKKGGLLAGVEGKRPSRPSRLWGGRGASNGEKIAPNNLLN